MKEESPIFIVGMPRSGTTLLRSLLNQHPLIAIAPETHFLTMYRGTAKTPESCLQEYLSTERFDYLGIEKRKIYDRLNIEHSVSYRAIFDAILKEYAHFAEKPIFGEKTPGHYEHLDKIFHWYPNAKVIWMARDPRAVCASYQHVNWHKGGGVIGPALRWRKSIKMLCKWEKDGRVHILQYENLITQPEKEFNALFKFLEMPPISYQRILAPRSEPQVNLRKNWAQEHFIKAAGSITTESLVKWKNQLSSRETKIIECIADSEMKKMNYELNNQKKLSDFFLVFYELLKLIFQKPDILVKKFGNLTRKTF